MSVIVYRKKIGKSAALEDFHQIKEIIHTKKAVTTLNI